MKKILLAGITIMMGLLMTAPVMAADVCQEIKDKSCVKSALFGDYYDSTGNKVNAGASGAVRCACDEGNGESVINLLFLVVDIMTIGIGILGVVGILIVGIQYLTAGGNEEKTRKAKRRMFEIVLGLVVYALIYIGVRWLLPGGWDIVEKFRNPQP